MISPQQTNTTTNRPYFIILNNNSMMTRHRTRKHIPRTPHTHSTKRPTIWHNSLYHLRSLLLHWIFLSILPFKPRPNPRTRRTMTAKRNLSTQPHRSSPPKHSRPISLRNHCHMSTPRNYIRKTQRSNTSTHTDNYFRSLLYPPSSNRIL